MKGETPLHDFFDAFGEVIKQQIAGATIARIVKYDKDKHEADVQPLFLQTNGDKKSMILACPVVQSCYAGDELQEKLAKLVPEFKADPPMLVEGSTVVVIFNDENMDNYENGDGNLIKVDSETRHQVSSGIVVGVIE
ncbi:hypothetical protein [Lactiplantibacillus mudanjiangensis]|uniref:Phage protein Gp138 N-terminal domain-containing protein n=1 Tax=Lactiplantibacillus mudanjiangensis TaxID=1296538 RepID=A0A660E4D3_9LACO|nr:hypothetical protein [Lactiplantibacillus mudanjiangensis]VDG23659.1 hypothetical protein [Lactobacillus parabuchneri] [Lactiplantibacillus mudanjiangensis]VDG27802.1 hypothetical protein [Lactobacillus parabuchneri] [Lactiplantibacillus mudanjiangensis]